MLKKGLGSFLEINFMEKSRKTFSANSQSACRESCPLPKQLWGKHIQGVNMQKRMFEFEQTPWQMRFLQLRHLLQTNAGYQAKPEYPLCTVEPKNQNIAEQWTCMTH
jgi:hypothetical protein